jgi:hypothetical protein
LVGTDPVAVRVLITTVVVVVIPVGSHGGRTDGSTVSSAAVAVAGIVAATGITSDRTAGTTRDGVTWTARTTRTAGDRVAWPRTACVMASTAAMDPPGVHPAAAIAATVEASGAHAPSTAAIAATTAASAAGVGIIGNERGGQ